MKAELKIMSTSELSRLEIIQKVADKSMKQKHAGKVLGLSTRQIRREVKKYRQSGVDGLISKKRGKPSNRKHSDDFKGKVVQQVQKEYLDFGPTLASEKLAKRNNLHVNKETLRQWMIEENIWKGKHQKISILHQQRARRACFGELVQIDGSPHDWFEGRAPKCSLLVFVDDATSRILQLRFEPAETTQGYFSATRNYIKQYGRPLAFYSDRHGIFRINKPEAKSGTGETQFGRAMRELGIKIICANSPQAKGRVERLNGVLQDRLVKDLRLNNINDIKSAHGFLPEFIASYNAQFAVQAADPNDAHRKALPKDSVLDLIFTNQCTRTLSKNLELSYNNIIYQIKTKGKGYSMRHGKVTVCDDGHGQISLIYKNNLLDYEIFDKTNQSQTIASRKEVNSLIDVELKRDGRDLGHKAKADHPWRQYEKVAKKEAKKLSQLNKEMEPLSGHLPTGSTSLAGV